MGFKCGIVGLPNVGKSTLFNALTNSSKAQAENFPFCTIDPNIGLVPVPDIRLDKLVSISNNKIEEATSSGTGPVDAIYKAIDKLIDIKVTLNEWRIEAVTEGIDAIGDAIVRLEKNNSIVIGRGSDTDVLVSSAKAYIDGLNKLTNNK